MKLAIILFSISILVLIIGILINGLSKYDHDKNKSKPE